MKSKKISELYNELINDFTKINVNSPIAEAKMVIEFLFKQYFQQIILEELEVTSSLANKVKEILDRRKSNEPIQYILGVTPFYNFELFVNKHVLIPRPETELLVEFAIKNLPQYGRLLDVGCGSGTICVTIAYERQDAQVTGVDVSQNALNVAKLNANHYNLKNIELKKSNLLKDVNLSEKFDIITANLPYISENEYLECSVEVKNFEPKLALVANDNGLELIYKLALTAKNHLNDNGIIIFEIGHNQSELLIDFLNNLNQFKSINIIQDYNQFNRFVYAII